LQKKENSRKTAERFSDEDWAMFLITSGFRWVDAIPDKTAAIVDEETGLTLLVERSTGHKCPRCWRYSDEIDENGLCMRCSSVLAK
jgi:isoleucyl-tRNA synthetase